MTRVVLIGLAATALLGAYAGPALAQDAVGDWHGKIVIPTGATLRFGLTIKGKAGGGYEGFVTSPDQAPGQEVPLDAAKVDKGALTFSVASIGGAYSGRWDAAQKAWVGDWTQAGTAMPLSLTAGKP